MSTSIPAVPILATKLYIPLPRPKVVLRPRGVQYELILAVNGYYPISDYLRALDPEGT